MHPFYSVMYANGNHMILVAANVYVDYVCLRCKIVQEVINLASVFFFHP